MKLGFAVVLVAAVSLAGSQTCGAQSSGIGSGSGGSGSASIIMPAPAMPAYSLVEETHGTQTLADGTHIERPTSIRKDYCDSQGRHRYELYVSETQSEPTPDDLRMLTITDPVENKTMFLSPREHVAHVRFSHPERQQAAAVAPVSTPSSSATKPAPAAPQRPSPKSVNEDLGTTTMNGVEVTGSRMTTTYPAGSVGNDRPFVSTDEVWVAREYAVDMLRKHDDPRSGTETRRVIEFTTTEPDASLFIVPPDYQIIEGN